MNDEINRGWTRAIENLTVAADAAMRRCGKWCQPSATCILADRQVTVRELDLLRANCDTLDCPLPPLVSA
jgi:hypothetical protein